MNQKREAVYSGSALASGFVFGILKQMDGKIVKERKKRALRMLKEFHRLFPGVPKTSLNYRAPFELLFAVILSAQCTDKKVNEVTERLFKKYTTLDAYASADPKTLERDIHETGYFRVKAQHIIGAAKMLKERFRGRLPKTMAEMVLFPGVGRKTANVALGNIYGLVEGIAVDTHVKRFAMKFHLSDSRDPVAIEKDLMNIIPRKEWINWTNYCIEYGRQICPARKHDCSRHPLTLLYQKAAIYQPASKVQSTNFTKHK